MRVPAYIVAVVLCGVPAWAGAEPAASSPPPVPPAPLAPRVLNVPTAHVQPSGRIFATGGAYVLPDRTPFLGLTVGLGGVADVDLEIHDRAAVCVACADPDDVAESIGVLSAAFKMGLPESFYAPWQPALSLGLRTSAGDREIDFEGEGHGLRAARMSLVATKTLGPVELTLGADAWDADNRASGASWQLHDQPLADRVRPLAGIVVHPPVYPRTRLLIDASWAPVFTEDDVRLRWLFGWGVRYQALTWGSIELDVRHREGGSLGDSEVSIRLNGAFDLLR